MFAHDLGCLYVLNYICITKPKNYTKVAVNLMRCLCALPTCPFRHTGVLYVCICVSIHCLEPILRDLLSLGLVQSEKMSQDNSIINYPEKFEFSRNKNINHQAISTSVALKF